MSQVSSLLSEALSLSAVLATETNTGKLAQEYRTMEYLVASLVQASAEQVLATATDSAVQASATSAASVASATLSVLSKGDNSYGMNPSFAGNTALAVIMGLCFAAHTVLGMFLHTWWFGISYILGTGLELAGYIARSISANDTANSNTFLCQIVCLTIAPCFIMAGIYFLLAQLIMIYGQKFAILKPMTYSYIFITCDVLSLLVQGSGGGMASAAVKNYKSSANGTHVMVAGLVFQVVSMSVFIVLYLHFCWKIRYLRSGHGQLEPEFNPDYKYVREKKWFRWFPLVVFLGVIFVYIRCAYRVAELSEGWRGYLITHEKYFLCLDALMMTLTAIIFIPFHPGLQIHRGSVPVEGTKAYRKMKEKHQKQDEFGEEMEFTRQEPKDLSYAESAVVSDNRESL